MRKKVRAKKALGDDVVTRFTYEFRSGNIRSSLYPEKANKRIF